MRPENMASSRTSSTTRSIWSRLWPKRQVSVDEIRRSQTLGVAALLFATLTLSLNILLVTVLSLPVLLFAMVVGMGTWRSCSEVKECRDRMPGYLYQRVEAIRGLVFVLGVLTIISTQHYFPIFSDIALIGPLLVYVWFAASIGFWLVNDSMLSRFADGG